MTGAKSGNYQLASTSLTSAIGTVTKKALALIGLSGTNKVYDATTAAALSGTANLSGIVIGDTVNIDATGTGSFADKDVGNAKAITVAGYTINGADASNYTINQPTALFANITKAALVARANNQVTTYGSTVPVGTVTYTGFVNGENQSVIDTLATVQSANSGILSEGFYADNYTATGALDNNYSFTYVQGNLTVNPANVIITPPAPDVIEIPTSVTYSSQKPMLPKVIGESITNNTFVHFVINDSTIAPSNTTKSDTDSNQQESTDNPPQQKNTTVTQPIVIEISPDLAKVLSLSAAKNAFQAI